MKKTNTTLKNIALITFILGGFIACETDFASIDSDVINPDNAAHFSTNLEEFSIVTYNKNIGPVRTNGLPAYLLGYHLDPVFGTSTSNIVAQISPSAFNPSFGDNIVLDSVILTIPYFSSTVATDDDGATTYTLDSVFGNSPIKLSVFKNNYFLRDFDPNSDFNEPQKYFSNGSTSENSFLNPIDLEGELLYENDQFLPSDKEIVLKEIDTTTNDTIISNRLAPSIRVKLNNPNDTFWQDLIFSKEGEPELSNINNFANHFRGLYLKAEKTSVNGSLMMLDIASTNAHITLYYTNDVDDPNDSGTLTIEKQGVFVLNFRGTRINLFETNYITIPEGDTVNGDENLYLKGGEGAMAVIDLFSGLTEDRNGDLKPAFTVFKESFRKLDDNGNFVKEDNGDFAVNRLINEAYLEFFVDQTIMQGEEPDRLYIFDLKNNTALIDYVFDQSVDETSSKIDHLVPLKRVDDAFDGEGIKYRIRITEHLNNLIIRDSTNHKLGLVVTTNVTAINNFELQNQTDVFSRLSVGAILSPRSTVLYGNNSSNTEKKAKFKIYFTEPDN